MRALEISEAGSNLSELVEALEAGREPEVIIARNGRPAARLVPINLPAKGPRVGVARGKFVLPPSIDECNDHIATLFGYSSE